MTKNQDPRLRAYVVWLPKVGAKEKSVPRATRFVPDVRATHFWDGGALLMKAYPPVLGISQDAWDVYMIYGPKARWDQTGPPKPDYWMHQLNVADAPKLDGSAFAAQVERFLQQPAALARPSALAEGLGPLAIVRLQTRQSMGGPAAGSHKHKVLWRPGEKAQGEAAGGH